MLDLSPHRYKLVSWTQISKGFFLIILNFIPELDSSHFTMVFSTGNQEQCWISRVDSLLPRDVLLLFTVFGLVR